MAVHCSPLIIINFLNQSFLLIFFSCLPWFTLRVCLTSLTIFELMCCCEYNNSIIILIIRHLNNLRSGWLFIHLTNNKSNHKLNNNQWLKVIQVRLLGIISMFTCKFWMRLNLLRIWIIMNEKNSPMIRISLWAV